jgi:fucose 4-O-acetylase-like acetyltransferase
MGSDAQHEGSHRDVPGSIAAAGDASAAAGGPRDAGIEALRGLAIVLVVAAHAGEPDGSRAVADLHSALSFVRMPLFAAVAGFVYALRPLAAGGVGTFLRGKARRLLLPMFSLSLLQFFLKITPPFVELPTMAALLRLAWRPNGHLWFLPALFLTLVVVALLDRRGLLATPARWLAASVLALASQTLAPRGALDWIDRPWAIDGFLYLVGYFLLGLGVCRFGPWLLRPRVARTALVVAIAGAALHQAARHGLVALADHKGSLLSLAVGCSVTLLLFARRRPIGLLSALGGSSLAIYLFHGFAFYAADVLQRSWHLDLGDLNRGFHYGMSLACALVLPLVAECLLSLSAVSRRLLLGER